MRISDWSSDVCSSDLACHQHADIDEPTLIIRLLAVEVGHEGRHFIEESFGIGLHFIPIQHANMRPIVALIGPHEIVADHMQERSEEHTSELQSLMRNSYAVSCLNK